MHTCDRYVTYMYSSAVCFFQLGLSADLYRKNPARSAYLLVGAAVKDARVQFCQCLPLGIPVALHLNVKTKTDVKSVETNHNHARRGRDAMSTVTSALADGPAVCLDNLEETENIVIVVVVAVATAATAAAAAAVVVAAR